jgi:histidinol-phosphate aminotransferase
MGRADYFRRTIAKMEGYVPGIQPKEKGWLKLNTNENPFPPSPKVMTALSAALNGSLAKYPDPTCDQLRRTIAKICRVKPSMVLVGNGSDEILAIIARSFLDRGRRALILHPTYSLFETIIEIQGAKLIKQKLDPDFTLPEEVFLRRADCAFVANPNPQAGTLFAKEDMARLAKTIGGILVIDEAYVDFAPRNCLPLVKKHRNVIVSRTLSKSYSLAGMRTGFAIASEALIEGMMKVKDSYNVNRLSQAAAIAALEDRDYFRNTVSAVKGERKFLTGALKKLGFRVLPSAANFILAEPPEALAAKDLYEELLARKVLVRFFDTKELRRYVRITVGNRQQNNELLKSIKLAMIRFKVDYPETSFGVVKF